MEQKNYNQKYGHGSEMARGQKGGREVMDNIFDYLLRCAETDPNVLETTCDLFRDKHPRMSFNVNGNIEQVIYLSPETSTYEDFLAVFGIDTEEDR